MSVWGATAKTGTNAIFTAEEGSLDLTHVTLTSGKYAVLRLCLAETPETTFTLARVTTESPSLRVQILLEGDTEFIVEGDAAASISLVGNIRMQTFPCDNDEDFHGISSEDESNDESLEDEDDDSSDDEGDFDVIGKLDKLLKMSNFDKMDLTENDDNDSSFDEEDLSDRICEVTEQEAADIKKKLPLKSNQLSTSDSKVIIPDSISNTVPFGTQVESSISNADKKKRGIKSEECPIQESLNVKKIKNNQAKESTTGKKLDAQSTIKIKDQNKTGLVDKTIKKEQNHSVTTSAKPAQPPKTNTEDMSESKITGVTRTMPGGVKYEVITLGTGKSATVGKRIKVKYEGRFAKNGKKFDSGILDFTIGAGDMIKGFDLGVRGMLLKEKRKVFVPSRLAYGKKQVQGIPPNSDLIFEITLVSIA